MNHPELRKAHAAMIGGDNREAINIVRTALMTEPNNASLWGMLADLLQMEGENAGAFEAVNRYLQLDPGDFVKIQMQKELLELVANQEAVENSTEKLLSSNGESRTDLSDYKVPAPGSNAKSPYQRALDLPNYENVTQAQYGKTPFQEPLWTSIGVGISIFSFVIGAVFFGVIIKISSEHTNDPYFMLKNSTAALAGYEQIIGALFICGIVQILLTLSWMSIDIVSRRKSIFWSFLLLLGSAVCCIGPYMGPGWFLIPLYFFAGRGTTQIQK